MSRTGAGTLILFVVLALAASACSSADSPATDESDLPRFEPATGALAALVGSTFEADEMPAVLGGDESAALAGSVIVSAEVASSGDEEVVAMHWFVEDDTANFVMATLDGRDDDGNPTWQAVSAWRLVRPANTVVTVGTNVCDASIHEFNLRPGEFVAVVNAAQDEALGAWVVTLDGPSAYADLDTLVCERFVP